MRFKSFILAMLFLTAIGFGVIPAMAQINPQQPQIGDPVQLTQELKSVVESADQELFKGFILTITNQVKTALINKIDVIILMFEKGNFQGGYKKLNNDVAPKLNFCETVRVRALSWLSVDPELEDAVYQFAEECQFRIGLIRLADPRPTP